MKQVNNVSHIVDCFGCGVCATVCPKDIIDIRLNSKGFYTPVISEPEMCIDCGLCTRVCSYCNQGLAVESQPIESCAVWSKDETVLKECSSGGASFEIGRILLEKGYKVCAVKYNNQKARAEHYIADSQVTLRYSIGSKYIQSYTKEAFAKIDKNQKYLVTGTPCQIDSIRRYLKLYKKEDNFLLLDFFCHSVPSYKMWKKYLQMQEMKVGKHSAATWRNKTAGWHDSWSMVIEGGDSKVVSKLSDGDVFYHLFLGDFCCNPACHNNCKFKYQASSADIRIGDMWGATYKNNDKGVSSVIAFSDRGLDVLNELRTRCHVQEYPFDKVAEGQMKTNAHKAKLSSLVWKCLNDERQYSERFWKILIFIGRLVELPFKVIRKLSEK